MTAIQPTPMTQHFCQLCRIPLDPDGSHPPSPCPVFTGQPQPELNLTKRISPEDYFDGFLAGLHAARDAIDSTLYNVEQARQIAQQLNNP